MSHDRKKAGERKDHKTKRMHESVEIRHMLHDTQPEKPKTDQHDVVPYKPGSARDRSMHQKP